MDLEILIDKNDLIRIPEYLPAGSSAADHARWCRHLCLFCLLNARRARFLNISDSKWLQAFRLARFAHHQWKNRLRTGLDET
jgi:hypothetical protein